ncbi:polysaccharide deacetylase family protein [Blastochloris viridis]|nr:polysaccharide deacetylase family protein [Blastochloris viridis]
MVHGPNAPALMSKPAAANPVTGLSPVSQAPIDRAPIDQAPVSQAPAALAPVAPARAIQEVTPVLISPDLTRPATSAAAPIASAPPVASAAPVPVAAPADCPGNPNAIGLARTVEIDTTGGPGFGFEHFKAYDFLKPGEVVLTFDDGPWPRNTPAVLEALAHHCTKATFFPVGKHTIWHPEILRQVAAQGHTIGSHTWSHVDLTRKTVDGKAEFEKGASAVHLALGAPPSPFFRFPALRHPPAMLSYLAERNVAVFSCDVDSFDFKTKKPEAVVKQVMSKLQRTGKGIILMHDFQAVTAKAAPMLLDALKAGGYRVVHLTAKAPLDTLPDVDAEVAKEMKGAPTAGSSGKPTNSVVRTIDGN